MVDMIRFRHEYDLPEQCGKQVLWMQFQVSDKFLQSGVCQASFG